MYKTCKQPACSALQPSPSAPPRRIAAVLLVMTLVSTLAVVSAAAGNGTARLAFCYMPPSYLPCNMHASCAARTPLHSAPPPMLNPHNRTSASPIHQAEVHPSLPHHVPIWLQARLSVALTPAERGWLLIGYGALPLACLALLKARPAAYRRHLFWLAWMHHSVLGIAHQLVDITPALQFSLPALQCSGVAGMLAWLAMLFLVTATNPGIPVSCKLCGGAESTALQARLRWQCWTPDMHSACNGTQGGGGKWSL